MRYKFHSNEQILILCFHLQCLMSIFISFGWGYEVWLMRNKMDRIRTGVKNFTLRRDFLKDFLVNYFFCTCYSVFVFFVSLYLVNYTITAGHFYGLVTRFLLNRGHLSDLFPDRLYCYLRNEKGEELFSSVLNLSFSNVYSIIYLVLWFLLAITILLDVALIIQGIVFAYSKTFRFRRLRQHLPSVNEKLLRRLSEEDFYISLELEYLKVAFDQDSFKELLDELVECEHFAVRVKRLDPEESRCYGTGSGQGLTLEVLT